ncbi:adhesion regulating molecule [Pisolithus albus]|nr:adhesion regulating molecule [Pisolithus albus]
MATLTDTQTLLAFKAGRSFRRGVSSFVDADPTKGAIVLSNGDDGLLHFMWKERPSGIMREDLILFPGDAKMERVTQERSGRTFVLRFDSSDQKHFFWMQDGVSARDDELVGNLNRFLADPTAVPIWNAGDSSASQQTSSSPDAAAGSSSGSGNMGSGSATYQLARLRALVTSMDDDDISLTDILTPQVILPLITSHPSLLPLMFQHLPPENTASLTEKLRRTIHSNPFRESVAQLDRVLRMGMGAGLVRGLGMKGEDGTSVGAFLRAVSEQGRLMVHAEESDSMDQD